MTSKPWFGEVILGTFFGAVVLLSLLLSPTPEVVSLFGVDVPMMCGFRQAFGIGCPGCGLTRSFSFMAHGQIGSAFDMNMIGPVLFAIFATQPPYRLYRAWRLGLFSSASTSTERLP